MEFPQNADMKASREYFILWRAFHKSSKRRAKRLKGGGSRQQINRRGVSVMVSYYDSVREFFHNCFKGGGKI
jgi:hypothetical protein